jgi:hypothetical protein
LAKLLAIFVCDHATPVTVAAPETTEGDRKLLKRIKEKAVSIQLWGMLYEGWTPDPDEEGRTVFMQGYGNRGQRAAYRSSIACMQRYSHRKGLDCS